LLKNILIKEAVLPDRLLIILYNQPNYVIYIFFLKIIFVVL